MQIQSGSWGDQTCRAMLRHSILCLEGFTCRKGNFVEPVPFQLERWDFTLRQTHDREMLGVRVCVWARVWGRQRKVEKKSREGIRQRFCQATWGKMHAWILLRQEPNTFTVILAATMEGEFSLSRLNTQTRTYTKQVAASPDNSFIVLEGYLYLVWNQRWN